MPLVGHSWAGLLHDTDKTLPHDSSNPLGPLGQGRLKLAHRVFDVCYPE